MVVQQPARTRAARLKQGYQRGELAAGEVVRVPVAPPGGMARLAGVFGQADLLAGIPGITTLTSPPGWNGYVPLARLDLARPYQFCEHLAALGVRNSVGPYHLAACDSAPCSRIMAPLQVRPPQPSSNLRSPLLLATMMTMSAITATRTSSGKRQPAGREADQRRAVRGYHFPHHRLRDDDPSRLPCRAHRLRRSLLKADGRRLARVGSSRPADEPPAHVPVTELGIARPTSSRGWSPVARLRLRCKKQIICSHQGHATSAS